MSTTDWAASVFVAMPFGKKTIADVDVDFDGIYRDIIAPGIKAAVSPEGAAMRPKRADDGFYAAVIDDAMYRALELSRFVLVDITGGNPNVFYEMGIRHRARASGTALIRFNRLPVPFDLSHTRVFTYDVADIEAARQIIRKVVEESMSAGELDSPVQAVLRSSEPNAPQSTVLRNAENALRSELLSEAEKLAAIDHAVNQVPDSELLLKCAVLANRVGQKKQTIAYANRALEMDATLAAAYRERGIAEGWSDSLDRAEASLRKAVELDPNDFDAWASFGGVLKRGNRPEAAMKAYRTAASLSNNHPYPLLNALKLKLELGMALTAGDRLRLDGAKRFREPQALAKPPFDVPWCFFDLSDIAWFQVDKNAHQTMLRVGASYATRDQIKSHRRALKGILSCTGDPTLAESIEFLTDLLSDDDIEELEVGAPQRRD